MNHTEWLLLSVGVTLALYWVIALMMDRSAHEKGAAILWVLHHADCLGEGGMYAIDICKITGISYSMIYVHLRRLEDSGFVIHTRDAEWPHRFRYHFITDDPESIEQQSQLNDEQQ